MLRGYILWTTATLLLTCTLPAAAADEDWQCPPNAEGVTDDVRELLTAGFHAADDSANLDTEFRALEMLTLRSGHCSAAARSTARETPGRDTNIEEWHAINQWLSRLVNIMGLNAHGDHRRTWRDEYALFAEVYEFEP